MSHTCTKNQHHIGEETFIEAQIFLKKRKDGWGNMVLAAAGSLSAENQTVIHKYQGTRTEYVQRTKGSRNRWGFPDASDKGPQSLIFKEAPADEKSKGVAGSIKVR